ncbi:MAG TPA: hypothetical protein VIT93_01605 [Dehalococcoidia bacterium]
MTNTRLIFLGGGLIVAMLAAISAIVGFNGTSSAQTNEAAAESPSAERPHKPPKDPNALLAVAIGTITHDDDDSPDTIDLRAHESAEKEGGAFRFYCDEMGYYNGGVKDVTWEDGVITASGAGGLWQPDGTRVQVQYTFTVDTETNAAEVIITGDGVDYETSGQLEGFSWAGTRSDAPPFAE